MRHIKISIFLLLGLILNFNIVHSSSYTSELKNDESKLHYGAINSVFVNKETSHTEQSTQYHDSSLTDIGNHLNKPAGKLKSDSGFIDVGDTIQSNYGETVSTSGSGYAGFSNTKQSGYGGASSTKESGIGNSFGTSETGTLVGTSFQGPPLLTDGKPVLNDYGAAGTISSFNGATSESAYGSTGAGYSDATTSTTQYARNYVPIEENDQIGLQQTNVIAGNSGISNSQESGFSNTLGISETGTLVGNGIYGHPAHTNEGARNKYPQSKLNGYGTASSASSSSIATSETAYGSAGLGYSDTATSTSNALGISETGTLVGKGIYGPPAHINEGAHNKHSQSTANGYGTAGSGLGNNLRTRNNFQGLPVQTDGGAFNEYSQSTVNGYGTAGSASSSSASASGSAYGSAGLGYSNTATSTNTRQFPRNYIPIEENDEIGSQQQTNNVAGGNTLGLTETRTLAGNAIRGSPPQTGFNGYSQSAVNGYGAAGSVYSGNAATSGSAYGSAGAGYTGAGSPYQQTYPPVHSYFPPGQVDPGFARFPPPQQGGPIPTYPQTHPWPLYPQTGPYPYYQTGPHPQTPHNEPHVHGSDYGHQHHNHNHHGYSTLDHTLTTNTEYKEEGHHEHNFQGTNNMGYGSGFGGTYNGGYKSRGY